MGRAVVGDLALRSIKFDQALYGLSPY